MPKYIFTKDPTAVLDFAMDWSTWLASGESISSYSVFVDNTAMGISTHNHNSGVVTAWLTGGNVGSNYTVSIRVGTNASRIDKRSFLIKVKNR